MTGESQVHLIEQGGRGGVFQHTIELALEIQQSGRSVTVHTADDFENVGELPLTFCRCVKWRRDVRFRPLRLIALVTRYLVVTLPHLARASHRKIAHLQGQFGAGLYALTLIILKLTAARCIYTPHNTFARSGGRIQEALLRRAVRTADIAVCFSGSDLMRLRSMRARRTTLMPLLQYVPQPPIDLVAELRRKMSKRPDLPLVALIGQLRSDKGVEDFLAAIPKVTTACEFVIAGEDAGFAGMALAIRDRQGCSVRILVDYFDLISFVAMVQAADLVVAPYKRASSSGVVSVAARVGTATVAYPVGGLVTSGAILTDDTTPEALARSIDSELSSPDARLVALASSDELSWIEELYSR